MSKGVRNDDINIRTVQMVVKKDWEEVYEDDPHVRINKMQIFTKINLKIIILD